jgi:hypothetical protein
LKRVAFYKAFFFVPLHFRAVVLFFMCQGGGYEGSSLINSLQLRPDLIF